MEPTDVKSMVTVHLAGAHEASPDANDVELANDIASRAGVPLRMDDRERGELVLNLADEVRRQRHTL